MLPFFSNVPRTFSAQNNQEKILKPTIILYHTGKNKFVRTNINVIKKNTPI